MKEILKKDYEEILIAIKQKINEDYKINVFEEEKDKQKKENNKEIIKLNEENKKLKIEIKKLEEKYKIEIISLEKNVSKIYLISINI